MDIFMLTEKVREFLKENGLPAFSAMKGWTEHKATKTTKHYWWNYFEIEGNWRGFHVYETGQVELVA